jgi:2-polyprenyl-3-methyl-5-hydroxy-6-metoxy-1,4-benzoquinol methylase
MKKTTRDYWDNIWESDSEAKAFDPNAPDIHQWVNQQFHAYFSNLFKHMDTNDKTLLEVGCGGSIWLPYFAKQYGFKIAGLDYSEQGCILAEKILQNEDVSGKIIWADLFQPPSNMIAAFDVVISFGLVEHFEDTHACLKAINQFLAPGGLLISFVPNMVGFTGLLQKVLNKQVYGLHVVLNSESLKSGHREAGLSIDESGYFLSFNPSMINIVGHDKKSRVPRSKKLIFYLLYQFSKIIWVFERQFFSLPATRIFSPYIFCIATKQQSQTRAIAF